MMLRFKAKYHIKLTTHNIYHVRDIILMGYYMILYYHVCSSIPLIISYNIPLVSHCSFSRRYGPSMSQPSKPPWSAWRIPHSLSSEDLDWRRARTRLGGFVKVRVQADRKRGVHNNECWGMYSMICIINIV